MKHKYPTPSTGISECERRYAMLAKPYDLHLLGMRQDRDTAFLFPGARGLESTLRRKWQVLQQSEESEETTALPIILFIHQQATLLEVYWAP